MRERDNIYINTRLESRRFKSRLVMCVDEEIQILKTELWACEFIREQSLA